MGNVQGKLDFRIHNGRVQYSPDLGANWFDTTLYTGWSLVERKVIPADVQSYDFLNLNGDVDEAYKISAEVIAGVGAAAGLLSCRPNGLTTNQSANGYEVDGAGAPANDTRTELALGFTDAAGRRSIAEATLIAKTGSDRVMISQCRLPSISRSVSFGSTWTDTGTNITSLRIFSANAAGLGIGTILTLFKRTIPG